MKLKDLWKRGANALSVQTARDSISCWNDMLPLYSRDCAVYDGLRRAIPVIDAAIDKIGRLVGGCSPICSNLQVQRELTEFFSNVRVGAMSTGMDSFIRCYLESLLTYGNAVGEIVLSGDGSSVAGLYNAPVTNLHFKNISTPLDVQICVAKNGLSPIPVAYPQLIVYSALCPRAGEIRGNSILSGLPFVSEVLMKILLRSGRTSSALQICAMRSPTSLTQARLTALMQKTLRAASPGNGRTR